MPRTASPLVISMGTGASDATRSGFCRAKPLTQSSHFAPLSFSIFFMNCAAVTCCAGSMGACGQVFNFAVRALDGGGDLEKAPAARGHRDKRFPVEVRETGVVFVRRSR